MTIPSELLLTLVTALVGAIVAFLEYLRRQLADNTAKTEQAKKAAASAEATSNGRLTEQIKLNQELQRENYVLKRLLDVLETEQDGIKALTAARAKLEMLRVMRPDSATPDKEQAS